MHCTSALISSVDYKIFCLHKIEKRHKQIEVEKKPRKATAQIISTTTTAAAAVAFNILFICFNA